MLKKPLKPFYDITPFTALDYPDHLAAIFWLAGCNMRCQYCYNKNIVFGEGKISCEEAMDFLKSRTDMLEGIVLSGGEATLYPNIVDLCKKVKALGFKIKLDTNGLNPEKIKVLVEKKLIDRIALDYKAPKEKFYAVTKSRAFNHFSDTLDFLISKAFPFEVRTTVHSDLLNVEDINAIIEDLIQRGYQKRYYLQKFIYTPDTIGNILEPKEQFDSARLSKALEIVWR